MIYEKQLMKLINKALKCKSVPVAAIVVDSKNKIIGRGYNRKEKTNNPLDHAEIMAIKKATKNKRTWKLNGCLLYVTMKPCAMCNSVINETRIRKVYYLVENAKEEYKNKLEINNIKYEEIKSQKLKTQYLSILRDFFSKKRKKSRKNDDNMI